MKLKQRYILYVVAGVILVTGLQWSVMFTSHLSEGEEIQAVTTQVMNEALERQLLLREDVLSQSFADRLVAPIILGQYGTIEVIALAALRLEDVTYNAVYDAQGDLIYDTEGGFAPPGERIDAEALAVVFGQDESYLERRESIVELTRPIMSGGVIIGAFKMRMSLDSLEASRITLQEALSTRMGELTADHFRQSLALSIFLMVIFATGGFIAAQRLVRPILRLKEHATQLGRGRFDVEPIPNRADELGELSDALVSAANNLKVTTISRAYFSNIVESMIDPVVVVNVHGRILDANSAAGKLLRADKSEILGQPFAGYCLDTKRRPAKPMDVRAGRVGFIQTAHGRVFPVLFSASILSGLEDRDPGYVCVFRDISDLLVSEQRLSDALQRAEAANRTKSAFIANTSHELRTPLNAIIGFAELIGLQTHGPLKEKYLEYLDDITYSARHLKNVVDDVLDLSKIEAGKLDLIEEEVDLHRAVSDCVRVIQPEADNRNISISMKGVSDALALNADDRYLRQMILNLLSNAVRYNRDGGRVVISTEQDDFGVQIKVSDTGFGMSAEEQEMIIEPFAQGSSALARKAGGTGLGLALTLGLINRHGGQLKLESLEGKGTTVTLCFPTRRVISSALPDLPTAAPMVKPKRLAGP